MLKFEQLKRADELKNLGSIALKYSEAGIGCVVVTFKFEILAAAPFQKVLTFTRGQWAHLRYFMKLRYMIQKLSIIQLYGPEMKMFKKENVHVTVSLSCKLV